MVLQEQTVLQHPPLFPKPFIGIYLFALQKDKCLSSFKKSSEQKLLS
jgi:hypothetical protein